jgi:pyocin large subunit-like protein
MGWSIVFAAKTVMEAVAEKGLLSVKSKNTAETKIDPEIIKKAEREAWELNNMLTYDGTPQEQFKDY